METMCVKNEYTNCVMIMIPMILIQMNISFILCAYMVIIIAIIL